MAGSESKRKKEVFKKRMKYLVSALIIVAVVATFFFFYKGGSDSDKNLDEFAQCLSDNGAVMYGTDWCPHCQEQKKRFGDSFEHIVFVDCDVGSTCKDNGVEGYPAWDVGGERLRGVQPLEKLAEMTGCKL